MVYIYSRGEQGQWTAPRRIVPERERSGIGFGAALDLYGDTLVVSALYADSTIDHIDPVRSTGAVYVFTKNGAGEWAQVSRLVHPDPRREDWFGVSLAIFEDRIVVGAPLVDGDCDDTLCSRGGAYVFRRRGNHWDYHPDTLEPRGGLRIGDAFGKAVDIYDGLIAVGAPNRGPADVHVGNQNGSVFLFSPDPDNNGSWQEVHLLEPNIQALRGEFGTAVALSDRSLAVGSPGTNAVAVYRMQDQQVDGVPFVLRSPTVDPEHRADDIDPSPLGGRFGQSLALSNGRLLVGAPYETARAQGQPGYVRCRQRAGMRCQPCGNTPVTGACQELKPPTVPCEPCGAHEADCWLCEAGAVYAYRRDDEMDRFWSPPHELRSPAPGALDLFGASATWVGDCPLVGSPQISPSCMGACGELTGVAYGFPPAHR